MVIAISVFAVFYGTFNIDSVSAAMSGSDVDTEAECRWCHCLQSGDSILYMPNRHHQKVDQPVPGATNGEIYNCMTASCHQMVLNPTTKAYEFKTFRDCVQCHTSNPAPGHHGRTDYQCTQCHEMRWVPSPGYYSTVLTLIRPTHVKRQRTSIGNKKE